MRIKQWWKALKRRKAHEAAERTAYSRYLRQHRAWEQAAREGMPEDILHRQRELVFRYEHLWTDALGMLMGDAPAQGPAALRDGDKLTYSVTWADGRGVEHPIETMADALAKGVSNGS